MQEGNPDMAEPDIHKGGCLCGAVIYHVTGEMRPVLVCHCRQCARWTGYKVMASAVKTPNLAIQSEGCLTWFTSSDHAERGFCAECGSNLFWRRPGSGSISIMAGTLTPPTGLKIVGHVFAKDRSDFDVIDDDLPQLSKHEMYKIDALVGDY